MAAPLPSGTSLDSLRKHARRWLKALRAGEAGARARFDRWHPQAPRHPGLRDIQHALAREMGFPSWAGLKLALAQQPGQPGAAPPSPLTSLLDAASHGDVDRLRQLLDAHPDLLDARGTLPGSTGARTALHFGVAHAPVVRLLLARGANPNIRDDGDNAMPLHFAAERQDLEVIRLLVEHGADPVGEGTMHELDVLGWATAWDYVDARPEVVEYLLAHGARYSMPSAVALGAVDAIRELARQSPADLNRPMDATNHRRRPLHLAIVKKQPGALATLLELGADPDARDRAGLTPLDQAALAGEPALAQMLIERGARLDLPAAVALGRTADIARLLADDPGCLAPGGRWGTLIVRAAERAPVGVLETLLRLGASPNAADDPATAVDGTIGLTPLHVAAFRGNVEAVRVLLAHGADPTRREQKYGSTPLGWAAYAGQAATRDLLLDTPIDIFDAIAHDRHRRVEEILDADPRAVNRTLGDASGLSDDTSWCTPLVWAVGHNRPALVRLLLARGAQVVAAPDGETLLDIAARKGFEEIAALLREQPSSGPSEASVWREAERAVIAGDVATLERLLARHGALFRSGEPPASTPGGLAPDYSPMDARAIVARNHAFDSWDAYAAFAAEAGNSVSLIGRFEEAADAMAAGDITGLEWLLRSRPELVHARSPRTHHATLLHYVGANGIEYFRQRTPANAPAIARLLIAAGADVHATADMYGGGSTVLGLAATSIHPEVAGVVGPLLQALLDGGATPGPDGGAFVNACLRNGRFDAASYLASRGAEVDLEGAAGLGRLDLVEAWFSQHGDIETPTSRAQLTSAVARASAFGHTAIVRVLLERGADARDASEPHRQTPLHWAAHGGHADTVQLLLTHGAALDAVDERWQATPLEWAFHGWQHTQAPPERYYAVVRLLVAAGATVKPEWFDEEAIRADPAMQAALRGA